MEILARRVAERIAALGTNDYQVSMESVGTADLVRDIKRGKMPGSQRLAALARTLGTTTDWLLGLSDTMAPGAGPAPATAAPRRTFTPEPRVIGQTFAPQPAPHGNGRDLPKDVPVLGNAVGSAPDFTGKGTAMELIEMGEVVDMVRRPPGLSAVKGAYALYVMGDSQSPRFEPGELIYVNPNRPAVAGDDVVVQLVDEDDCVNCALVKRLLRRTPTGILLRQFNPNCEFEVPNERIKPNGIHRVMTFAELYGY